MSRQQYNIDYHVMNHHMDEDSTVVKFMRYVNIISAGIITVITLHQFLGIVLPGYNVKTSNLVRRAEKKVEELKNKFTHHPDITQEQQFAADVESYLRNPELYDTLEHPREQYPHYPIIL